MVIRNPFDLVAPTPLMTPQVRGVANRLEACGFQVVYSEVGGFAAYRRCERGLQRVVRLPNPASLWVTFAGWPERSATLAEVRAWCDTFGESG